MVLCSTPKFGPHPGGSYGGQGGLSFYVGAKGRQWSQISYRKLKFSISHGVVILASELDAMLKPVQQSRQKAQRAYCPKKIYCSLCTIVESCLILPINQRNTELTTRT